ncbi:hypothetical protein ACVWWR_001328 [Bradyrhizobium sp. LM3.2]
MGGVYPEASKAEIGVFEGRDLLAERKVRLAVLELGSLSLRDLEDGHPVLVEEAAMEELRFERKILAAPERTLGQEADRTVLIVVEVLQAAWQLLVRRLVRFAGQLAGQIPHCGRPESVIRRARSGGAASRGDQQCRQHGRPLNKLASVHVLSYSLLLPRPSKRPPRPRVPICPEASSRARRRMQDGSRGWIEEGDAVRRGFDPRGGRALDRLLVPRCGDGVYQERSIG